MFQSSSNNMNIFYLLLLSSLVCVSIASIPLQYSSDSKLDGSFNVVEAANLTVSSVNGKNYDELVALVDTLQATVAKNKIVSTTTSFLGILPATWTTVMSLSIPVITSAKAMIRAELCPQIVGTELLQCRFKPDVNHRELGRPASDGLICLTMTTVRDIPVSTVIEVECQAASGVTFASTDNGLAVIHSLSALIIPGGFVSSKVVPPAESVTGTNSYIADVVYSDLTSWSASVTPPEPSVAFTTMDISISVPGSTWVSAEFSQTGYADGIRGVHWQLVPNYSVSPVRISTVESGVPVDAVFQRGHGSGTANFKMGEINLVAFPQSVVNDYEFVGNVKSIDFSTAPSTIATTKTFMLTEASPVMLYGTFGISPKGTGDHLFTIKFYANSHLLTTKIVGSAYTAGYDAAFHVTWFGNLPSGFFTFSVSVEGPGTASDGGSYGNIWDQHLIALVINP